MIRFEGTILSSSMTCIFWNVNGKDRTDLICRLVAEKESDVVVLAESGSEDPAQILPPEGKLPDYLNQKVFRTGERSIMADHIRTVTKLFESSGTWVENEWLATSPAQFTEKIEAVLSQPVVKAAVLLLLARSIRSDTPEANLETPDTTR